MQNLVLVNLKFVTYFNLTHYPGPICADQDSRIAVMRGWIILITQINSNGDHNGLKDDQFYIAL